MDIKKISVNKLTKLTIGSESIPAKIMVIHKEVR